MYDGIKLFLEWVGYFFIAYLIGYSTFLFLSVVVGSLELYKHRRQEMLKSILPSDYYLPISIIVPAYNEEVGMEVNSTWFIRMLKTHRHNSSSYCRCLCAFLTHLYLRLLQHLGNRQTASCKI